MLIDDVVHTVPLLSAALWAFLSVGAFARYSVASPFVRALTLFSILVAAGCFVDWYLLTSFNPNAPSFAIILANLRTSLLAVASLVILLASKWLARGHSRYDALLVIPVVVALLVIWGGMTSSVSPAPGGEPVFGRNLILFGVFVVQEVAYYLVACAFALSVVVGRADLPSRLRRPALLSIAALLAFVILWLPTNVYVAFSNLQEPSLFSSVMVIPAAMVAVAFVPRTKDELGEIFRAVSEVERRVQALYVFYRSGEPLAAVAAGRTFPIEAEQLEGILEIIGNFVETSMKRFQGYAVTAMRFDRLGIVAVRGQFLIVAAVYEGAAYDAIRSELLRSLRDFEKARAASLTDWEGASRIAEQVADDLSRLLQPPASSKPSRG